MEFHLKRNFSFFSTFASVSSLLFPTAACFLSRFMQLMHRAVGGWLQLEVKTLKNYLFWNEKIVLFNWSCSFTETLCSRESLWTRGKTSLVVTIISTPSLILKKFFRNIFFLKIIYFNCLIVYNLAVSFSFNWTLSTVNVKFVVLFTFFEI